MPHAVSLTQLVDLALGTPEVGAVNFNILHTLLHAMITKLGIEEVKAEVNEHDREFLSSVILKPHTRERFFQGTLEGKGSQLVIKDRSVTSLTKVAVDTSAVGDPSGPSANIQVESAGGRDKDSAKPSANIQVESAGGRDKDSAKPSANIQVASAGGRDKDSAKPSANIQVASAGGRDKDSAKPSANIQVASAGGRDKDSAKPSANIQVESAGGRDKDSAKPSANIQVESAGGRDKDSAKPSANIQVESAGGRDKDSAKPSANIQVASAGGRDKDSAKPSANIQVASAGGRDKDSAKPSANIQVASAGGRDKDSAKPSANIQEASAGGRHKNSAKVDDSFMDDVCEMTSYIPAKPTTYHLLEQRVDELTKALADLNALPTTCELMEEISKTKSAPPEKHVARVADMWQNMQLKKRVDANEEGVGKLMQMINDMMKEVDDQREENERRDELVKEGLKFDGDDYLKRLEALEKYTDDLRKDLVNGLNDVKNLTDQFGTLPNPEEFSQFVRWGDLEDALKGIRNELDKMTQPEQQRVVSLVEFSMQTDPQIPDSRPASAESSLRPGSSRSGPSDQLLEILETLGNISQKHLQLQQRVTDLEGEMENKMDKKDLENLGNMSELLEELKKLRSDMQDLQDAVAELQKMAGADSKRGAQMDDLLKKIQEDGESLKGLQRLQQMLGILETTISTLKDKTRTLEEDGRNKDLSIEKLFGLCGGLEKIKADKEYVAMEVDVKADRKQLDGKVNQHLFDSTTAGINRTIQDILDKLSGTSDEWKNMLAKLTNDLDGKLDRLELNPLKEWLEKKLKALSKKIKEGSLQWTDDEAAGLKKQLIQHYHCLSCDKPINMMATGIQQSLPANYGMPPSRSPRPYTTFELDQIRQQGKRIYSGTSKPQRIGSPEQADVYATSRQCGGSHTTTMPHQRFTKVNTANHLFREEEQEDIIAIHKEELDIMGADGHIYRGRVQRLDARIPSKMMRSASANRQNNAQTGSQSPRPASARGVMRTPEIRQTSGQGSRPQSARFSQRSDLIEQRSGATTLQMDKNVGGEINVDVPLEMPPVQVRFAWGRPVSECTVNCQCNHH
ncbi:uncharacterized protein [Littorina saxatilis]|uniref:uncharacterized protein isoform X2 n=1 Tax=Littorina saxatilis TaxID=31220 RepID=UPI0038B59433